MKVCFFLRGEMKARLFHQSPPAPLFQRGETKAPLRKRGGDEGVLFSKGGDESPPLKKGGWGDLTESPPRFQGAGD
jgi:hypothetical protein